MSLGKDQSGLMAKIRACALIGLAFLAISACSVSADRFPTSKDYPPGTMARISVIAGGPSGWKLSALGAGASDASWKVVIVTGTPSWSEYWAPTLAATPPELTVVVADRPGFADSEPAHAVTDIAAQAEALSVFLKTARPDQKIILIGQSYGGPVATLMAAQHPDQVKALVLMSAFFGDRGPTIRRLDAAGALAGPILPRDLRNGLTELRGLAPQLPAAKAALARLTIPIIVLHGDADSFVPYAAAERLAASAGANAEFIGVPGGDHFLNACCVAEVLRAAERAMDLADARAARAKG